MKDGDKRTRTCGCGYEDIHETYYEGYGTWVPQYHIPVDDPLGQGMCKSCWEKHPKVGYERMGSFDYRTGGCSLRNPAYDGPDGIFTDYGFDE